MIGGGVLVAVLANAPTPAVDPAYYAQHPQTPMSVLVTPPKPQHHYVAIVRGYFGYQAGLSDNDRANGLASKPLTLVGYQVKRGTEYSFSISDGGPYAEYVTCNEP